MLIPTNYEVRSVLRSLNCFFLFLLLDSPVHGKTLSRSILGTGLDETISDANAVWRFVVILISSFLFTRVVTWVFRKVLTRTILKDQRKKAILLTIIPIVFLIGLPELLLQLWFHALAALGGCVVWIYVDLESVNKQEREKELSII